VSKLFGTDGIRGEAGRPPLDARTTQAIGRALAGVLAESQGHPPRVVIGRDTRESGPGLLADLVCGLRRGGATARSAGVIPTPGVSFLARSGDFDAGIVISASHNPYRDNGLKVFSTRGTKLPDALEEAVERRVAELLPTTTPGRDAGAPEDEPELARRHADWLVERGRAPGVSLDGLRACVDCAHGAASPVAADVLARLGVEVTPIGCSPDGRNINLGCGSLHLGELARAVVAGRAELGIAFDGDADRALFVDAGGQPVDGDQVLLIAADCLRGRGALRGGGVVGTVMSNLGLEKALADRGLALVREKVGDRFVLERMLRDGYNLGGEQSGHVIFLDEAPTGDGILTALQVLAAVRRSGRTLRELASALVRCPQVLHGVRVRTRVPLEEVDGYPALAEHWSRRLGGSGRILVRYSGTERLLRVMVEGTDGPLVEECAAALVAHLERVLGDT
jgi:phosphoglucosamine mutase